MDKLLASSESIFKGVRVISVEPDADNFALIIRFSADEGKWYAPSCDTADYEGWVDNEQEDKLIGELEFILDDSLMYQRFLKNLVSWRDEKTLLDGIASVKTQVIGLFDPKKPMTKDNTAIVNLELFAQYN